MPIHQSAGTVIFISELKHISVLESFLASHSEVRTEEFCLIPLDLEIEHELTRKGIPFTSGRSFQTLGFTHMVPSEEFTASVFNSAHWSFFSYRGVSLGGLYFLPVQWYFSHVLYYADMVSNALNAFVSAKRVVVFSTAERSPYRGSTLVVPQMKVIVDVVEYLSKRNGKKTIVIPMPSADAPKRALSIAQKRRLFCIGIGFLNMLVMLLRRPQRLRVLASDYWSNIEPYLTLFDSMEVVLIDRTEAFNAGLWNIWKHRMRFLNLNAFPVKAFTMRAKESERISRQWQSLKDSSMLPAFELRGISLRPLCMRALDMVVAEAAGKTLSTIDNAYALLERIKPQMVLLRVTGSTQTHFIILAHVARTLGIPSMELQHGLEYCGPGSQSRTHSAQYTGVYGALSRREMEKAGNKTTIPVIIGSPRFDAYSAFSKAADTRDTNELSFLCIAPTVDPCGGLDTYKTEDYFDAVAAAIRRVPNAKVVIKLRPGYHRDVFIRQVLASCFAGVPHTIAQAEPLAELCRATDVVISGYSTAVLEALQFGRPLVFLGLSPEERMMGLDHFTQYQEAGAIRIAVSKDELIGVIDELAQSPDTRARLSGQAAAFLKREYSFDGHASERTAAFIRSLIDNKRAAAEK